MEIHPLIGRLTWMSVQKVGEWWNGLTNGERYDMLVDCCFVTSEARALATENVKLVHLAPEVVAVIWTLYHTVRES